MKPWYFEETYELVSAAFGSEQQELVKESARSVVDRQRFARYHFREALRLSKHFERRNLRENMLYDLYSPQGEKARIAFEIFIVKAGAHMTAAVQSIHAIPDILAHAAYFATGRNLGAGSLPERGINLQAVVRSIRNAKTFHSVAPILESSCSGDSWRHLAALANASKHRTVIRTALNEDLTGNRERHHELHLDAFEREGEYFPSVSVHALLESEYTRLAGVVLSTGHEINACLQAKIGS